MSKFSATTSFSHDMPERTGVLLIQLGTPEKPEAGPVRRYLREFLSDKRVVEIPSAIWQPILNGAILPTRPRKSAEKYASVWTKQGSPLKVNTQLQAKLLQGYCGDRGLDLTVDYAMRYGEPSVKSVLQKLREANVTRLMVIPLYPQYAGATTATAFDALARELMTWRNIPELRFIRGFHKLDAYIDALAEKVQKSFSDNGRPDKLLMSFHGVPEKSLLDGDPYHCECHVTARLLAEKLKLPDDQWEISFQSRFGKAKWIGPATDAVLTKLGKAKTGRVDVVCPGFVSDCLETLEEINIEGRETYLEAGGDKFNYIDCLNDSPKFVLALAQLIAKNAGGWPAKRLVENDEKASAASELTERASRARALGAKV
jgi:ferrochelatase